MCARRSTPSKLEDKVSNYLKEGEHIQAFRNQLRRYNLKLRNIIGDGNCLFRSFADQMDGDQNSHQYYREKICHFIKMNRKDFEPFIIDESFDEFIEILSKDGTFGGNECLVAFSRLFDAKICIHQLNKPIWIICFSNFPKHEIHISYHNFVHYSSVRKLDDDTPTLENTPQLITANEYDIDYIQSQITNTTSRQSIRNKLIENNGDLDRTIEESNELIEEIISTPSIVENSLELKTNEETEKNQSMKKPQCLPNNQIKINKKKAKQERAMEKHRAQILAEKKLHIPVNNQQEYVPPANMEFIRI